MEVEDFVDSELLLELNKAGVHAGEDREAPSWTGHDLWVLSAGGVDGEPFSIVCSVRVMYNSSCTGKQSKYISEQFKYSIFQYRTG